MESYYEVTDEIDEFEYEYEYDYDDEDNLYDELELKNKIKNLHEEYVEFMEEVLLNKDEIDLDNFYLKFSINNDLDIPSININIIDNKIKVNIKKK